ncbi:MAG: secretion protein HlyD [Burkholderiales bacterium]|nr:secretion protein HlyD [Burkholderiales bacterium]
MNKKLVVVAVLAAGAIAAWQFWPRLAPAANGTIYGNIDIREVNLAFRSAGRLMDLKVDEGSKVKAGEVLAVLDTEPLMNSLHSAESALAAVKARNSLLHQGYRSEDKEQAKARVVAAQAALQEAERVLARQRELVPQGAAAQRALDSASNAREQAASQLKVAQQHAQAMNNGWRKEEIAESDALVAQASSNLANAQLALRDAALIAPSDGVVLTRALEKGAMVQVGTPVFSLSLVKPVWARAYVSEAQLGQFGSGRKVVLLTDARPGKPYHGVVGFVSPSAEFTPKSVETTDLRTALVYRLRIVVEDADEQLRQGMPVTVQLAQ